MNHNANSIYERAALNGLTFVGACYDIDMYEWTKRMEGARPASREKVELLISQHPEFDRSLLEGRNPYRPKITKGHIIYIHSAVEYFFRINPSTS